MSSLLPYISHSHADVNHPIQFDNKHAVIFNDGSRGNHTVYILQGACIIGDPTAYITKNGKDIFVTPIASGVYHEI